MRLQLDASNMTIFAIAAGLWLLAAILLATEFGRHGFRWRAILLSLFGFAWVGFGAGYILRFVILLCDPVLTRATQYPLWQLPEADLGRAWGYLGLYWTVFCLGALGAFVAARGVRPPLSAKMGRLELWANVPILDLLAVTTFLSAVIVYAGGELVPGAVVTPLGHFSRLRVFPACVIWYLHFRGHRTGARRYAYLVPGLAAFLLNPYREILVEVFLCVFLPMLLVKGRARRGGQAGFLRAALIAGVMLMAFTVLVEVYRPMKWGEQSWETASQYISWEQWVSKPEKAPWTEVSRRFHGFDSAALTFYLVPKFFPYENRSLSKEFVISLIPRGILLDKVRVQRGRIFSTSIWAYSGGGKVVRRPSAMIAPSMPGDLWSSGGMAAVLLGALAWGVLVGLLDGWRRRLPPGVALALVAFLGLSVAAGFERDFVLASATIVQQAIVLLAVLAVAPLRGERRVARAAEAATACGESAAVAAPGLPIAGMGRSDLR